MGPRVWGDGGCTAKDTHLTDHSLPHTGNLSDREIPAGMRDRHRAGGYRTPCGDRDPRYRRDETPGSPVDQSLPGQPRIRRSHTTGISSRCAPVTGSKDPPRLASASARSAAPDRYGSYRYEDRVAQPGSGSPGSSRDPESELEVRNSGEESPHSGLDSDSGDEDSYPTSNSYLYRKRTRSIADTLSRYGDDFSPAET